MKIIKLLVVFLLITNTIFAQTKAENVEIIDLIKDIIQTSKDGEDMKQVFWLPQVYWELALKDSPYGTEATIKEINSIVENYAVFAISDVTISAFSGIKKNELESVELIVDGKVYNTIESIPDNLESLLSSLKPVFSKMLGQFGNSIEVFAFDNSDKIIPLNLESGKFSVKVNNETFDYRLPLASLVEKKVCPEDNEKLNGNWMYCPWHGKKLE